MKKTNNIVLTGMFIALGILIPFILGHAFGVRGVVLLPMHLPVLVCGLLCGPLYGLFCGAITPIFSSILTGMPATFPMLPVLVCELSLYGFLSGWTYKIKEFSINQSLISSIAVGRVVNGIVLASLLTLQSKRIVLLTALYSVLSGMPGVLIQILLIPSLISQIESLKYQYNYSVSPDIIGASKMSLNIARAIISSGKSDCVLIKNNQIVDQEKGRGIVPLMRIYNTRKNNLKGAVVVDKVIGKAAAMICVSAEAKGVFAEVISSPAAIFLKYNNIPRDWAIMSPNIRNRANNGICPMEHAVLTEYDEKKGLLTIEKLLEQLQKTPIPERTDKP